MADRQTRPAPQLIKLVYDQLFHSGNSLSRLKEAALGGRLFRSINDGIGVAGRSLAWKLFLLPLEPLEPPPNVPPTPPIDSLRKSRMEYSHLLLDKMRAPDGSYVEGFTVPGLTVPRKDQSGAADLETNNPLSLHDENPWKAWFASVELRKTILQDVERTFPDIGYFRNQDVQQQLTNVLFLYAVMHPDIGYRQGMHELLAPLYFAIDFDSISESSETPGSDFTFQEICSRTWVAADSWALFLSVMRGISRWYEWREAIAVTESNALGANGQVTLKPYVAPIVETCNKIQGTFLRTVDPALYKSMQSAGIEPQIYGIRWLRLLFTREFPMHDAMALWDGLFSCVSSIADTTEWICVAMLIRIRNKLIPSDYSTQLTYLLRYPPTEEGSLNHIILLLRQAAALEMTRTPSTGASLVVENRNILNIPVDIPDPPMGRRRPRPGERGHQVSPSEGHFQGITGAHGENIRSPSHQMGIPELLARGLLDRGESLGINKTFMNAVSELKRNLPDLAASLVRTPSASSASYAAYPLLDERPQEERPSWEPRSRFEMEREVSEMRQLNKRLGESVGWIVDVLLQDEDGIEDAQQLSTIQNKKREALESLSYVRDVLNSGVSNVEEDRLWGADEYKRREEKYQAEASENEGREESSQLNVPRSAPDPVTLPLSNAADNSRKFDNKFASFPRDNRRFSPNTSSATPSSTRGFMRPPGFPLSSKTPPNLVPNTSTSLAPWSYPWTQAPVGSSSGGHSPNTVHPSIPVPPREVTRPLVGLHSYRTANSIIGTHQVADKVADQSPKTQDTTEVQHDPLGVLR